MLSHTVMKSYKRHLVGSLLDFNLVDFEMLYIMNIMVGCSILAFFFFFFGCPSGLSCYGILQLHFY